MSCRINNKTYQLIKHKQLLWYCLVAACCFSMMSCKISAHISKQARSVLLNDSAIRSGFIGISIYEPASNTYWYNYQAGQYFIPASNTKLFSLYAGMKFLGDSIRTANIGIASDAVYLFPNGDPSFLNPEFPHQPLLDILKQQHKKIIVVDTVWREQALGYGWAWDDYNDDYMAERAALPVFGDVLSVSQSTAQTNFQPEYFKDSIANTRLKKDGEYIAAVKRDLRSNQFNVQGYSKKTSNISIPFITDNGNTNYRILQQLTGLPVVSQSYYNSTFAATPVGVNTLPADSLYSIMMHRSDNFFAEQTLLMVSNQQLGYMKDGDIIARLLKTDLSDIPQKPNWVDGSGLSRYNLFTPQSMVYIIRKMSEEWGWDRLKQILPTGGTGTLKSYYKKEAGRIYAKTGTLSNNCSLSGFLVTNKGKTLIFSILANHYQTGATPIRQAVERFLQGIMKKY
jgi:D-alanyl-D-alanine carboxypeptidase/D-alanyl-D-alanine-endopeptidase (penicillin-binding protein 4)